MPDYRVLSSKHKYINTYIIYTCAHVCTAYSTYYKSLICVYSIVQYILVPKCCIAIFKNIRNAKLGLVLVLVLNVVI